MSAVEVFVELNVMEGETEEGLWTVINSPMLIKNITAKRWRDGFSNLKRKAKERTKRGEEDFIIVYIEIVMETRERLERAMSREAKRPMGRPRRMKVRREREGRPPEVRVFVGEILGGRITVFLRGG